VSIYPVNNAIVYDVEVYPNFFLVGFELPDGRVYQYDDTDTAGMKAFVDWVAFSEYILVGFNSRNYDDPVLTGYLDNPTPQTAYTMSQRIIVDREKPWNFDNAIWSVDLMPVLPGRMSLKKLGVCLGHKKLQELPIRYDKDLTEEEKDIIRTYNINDLEITRKLYNHLLPELELRSQLSDLYRIDLRSKGEAQIAEMVLLKESNGDKKELNTEAWRRVSEYDHIQVNPPSWWGSLK